MTEFNVHIGAMEIAYDFINETNKFNCEMDLISSDRRFIVNAKSILGVMSLDLSKKLYLKLYSDDPVEVGAIRMALIAFIDKAA